MKRKIQIYKIGTTFSTALWLFSGAITIGSIANGPNGIYINITVGIIFLLIGLYTQLRVKSINTIVSYSDSINKEEKTTYSQLLLFELIFTTISIIVGLIALSTVISRTFMEGLPVFG